MGGVRQEICGYSRWATPEKPEFSDGGMPILAILSRAIHSNSTTLNTVRMCMNRSDAPKIGFL